MPGWAELVPFAVLGLAGSLHCAGMCGGFALAVTASAGEGRRAALAAALLHVLGKALTYAVLGAVAAGAVRLATHGGARLLDGGADDGHLAHVLALQRAAAWIGGGLFALLALQALGLLPARAPRPGGGRWAAALGFLTAQARALPRRGRGFYTGLVNGLLPCGLTVSALALAGAGGSARAALGMLVFGLGTAPVLVAIGLGGARLGGALRGPSAGRWVRAAALLALAFGVVTVLRGTGAPVLEGGCCGSPPAASAAADAP